MFRWNVPDVTIEAKLFGAFGATVRNMIMMVQLGEHIPSSTATVRPRPVIQAAKIKRSSTPKVLCVVVRRLPILIHSNTEVTTSMLTASAGMAVFLSWFRPSTANDIMLG